MLTIIAKNTPKDFLSYSVTCGIGWIIMMLIFALLIYVCECDVFYTNYISSLISITYVFVVTKNKNYIDSNKRIAFKYILFILSQLCSIWFFSHLIYFLSKYIHLNTLYSWESITIFVRIIITPVTLLLNYFVTKYVHRI